MLGRALRLAQFEAAVQLEARLRMPGLSPGTVFRLVRSGASLLELQGRWVHRFAGWAEHVTRFTKEQSSPTMFLKSGEPRGYRHTQSRSMQVGRGLVDEAGQCSAGGGSGGA